METLTSEDFGTASRWADEILGEGGPARFFLAPSRFVSATRTFDSLAFTLDGDESFGMSLGPTPLINSKWRRFFVDECLRGPVPSPSREIDRWNFYSIDTTSWTAHGVAEIVTDDEEIRRMLESNAPDSSVWPGRNDIINWYGLRDSAGALTSLGALVRWESGSHVVASVATAPSWRGNGLAQQVTAAIVAGARDRGVKWLGLGVHHENLVAQHVYESVGFILRARFIVYAR